jgi:amidophosphoribosyltransferase
MAKMGDFIAFNAAVALLKDSKQEHILTNVYDKCKAQAFLPKEEMVNYIQEIYSPFTADEISVKIGELLTPKSTKAKVKIIYQSISDLHASCPEHKGDWYFTGNYPTPGGVKVVNKAFMNYIEGNNTRAY